MKCIKWSSKEDILIKEIYPRIHNDNIEAYFPSRSRDAIKQRASFLKVQKADDYTHKYNINHSFFAETKRSAYIAGFIAADGYLSSTRYMISINLSGKDRCILENIQNIIQTNSPIKTIIRNNKEVIELHLYSKTCVKDLNYNFNIPMGRKSDRIQPPNLQNKQDIINFIVGLIDGDGSICYGFKNGKKRKDGTCNKEQYFTLHIMGTHILLSWIEEFLRRNIPYSSKTKNNKNVKSIQKMKGTYRLSLTGIRGLEIAKYLKDNSVEYKLQRKWNRVNEYIKFKQELDEAKLANA